MIDRAELEKTLLELLAIPSPSGFTDEIIRYIGSRLEIMEVATGHRKILYSSAHSIQAPLGSIRSTGLLPGIGSLSSSSIMVSNRNTSSPSA